jgi:hypothetical protein
MTGAFLCARIRRIHGSRQERRLRRVRTRVWPARRNETDDCVVLPAIRASTPAAKPSTHRERPEPLRHSRVAGIVRWWQRAACSTTTAVPHSGWRQRSFRTVYLPAPGYWSWHRQHSPELGSKLGDINAQTPGKTSHHPVPEDEASQQEGQPRRICKTSIPGSNPRGASNPNLWHPGLPLAQAVARHSARHEHVRVQPGSRISSV